LIHLKSIRESIEFWGIPEPKHTQFLAIRPSEEVNEQVHELANFKQIRHGHYIVAFKKITKGVFHYGRTEFDSTTGVLILLGPDQLVEVQNIEIEPGGFSLLFEKDFFLGHPLFNNLSKYGFFDYSLHEALHLSPREETTLQRIYDNIESEYNNYVGESSKELIISHVETLLKYVMRFYKRQFLNRQVLNSDLFQKFKVKLDQYISDNNLIEKGPPTLDWLANELSVSKRYLSDSIKTETGKTAKDQVNLFLIEQAKNLLLEPNASISTTAYKLGFEYPQYFTRLFKKKTGMSPKTYIKTHSYQGMS